MLFMFGQRKAFRHVILAVFLFWVFDVQEVHHSNTTWLIPFIFNKHNQNTSNKKDNKEIETEDPQSPLECRYPLELQTRVCFAKYFNSYQYILRSFS